MSMLDAGFRLAIGAVRTGLRIAGIGGDGPSPQAEPPQAPTETTTQARPKPLGDGDLTNKVRTVVLRGLRGDAKGAIDINVVDGAVYLRGTAKTPQAINRLEEKARTIPEVTEVHNLLHLPNTPAPTRTDTPPAQRKTRRGGAAPKKPRTEPRRLNADKTIAHGEPLPEQLARERSGRKAAPLGSKDTSGA